MNINFFFIFFFIIIEISYRTSLLHALLIYSVLS